MTFVDLETAKAASGIRLALLGGAPSPWSQAAKGILDVKGLPYVAVRYMVATPPFLSGRV